MPSTDPIHAIIATGADYDAVDRRRQPRRLRRPRSCSAAPALRVALVEKQPDPQAFKRICSHFIQASGVPAIERLGLLEPIEAAGALRPHIRIWTRWGWIEAPPRARRRAASTCAARCSTRWCARPRPRRRASSCCSAGARERCCARAATLRRRRRPRPRRARSASCAAGSSSAPTAATRSIAELVRGAGQDLPARPLRLRRLLRRRRRPQHAPDATIWFLDPQWAAAFPTDERPHLLRGDADQGAPAGVQARPARRRW